jgi:hypothetical protein
MRRLVLYQRPQAEVMSSRSPSVVIERRGTVTRRGCLVQAHRRLGYGVVIRRRLLLMCPLRRGLCG